MNGDQLEASEERTVREKAEPCESRFAARLPQAQQRRCLWKPVTRGGGKASRKQLCPAPPMGRCPRGVCSPAPLVSGSRQGNLSPTGKAWDASPEFRNPSEGGAGSCRAAEPTTEKP